MLTQNKEKVSTEAQKSQHEDFAIEDTKEQVWLLGALPNKSFNSSIQFSANPSKLLDSIQTGVNNALRGAIQTKVNSIEQHVRVQKALKWEESEGLDEKSLTLFDDQVLMSIEKVVTDLD